MKRLALIVISLLFISLASCKTNDTTDIPSDKEATKDTVDIPSDAEATEDAEDMQSDTGDTENTADIQSDTEATEYVTEIPPDIEIAYVPVDKVLFEDLKQVEDDSTIIVEGYVRKNLGQNVSTVYDEELKKELPGAGYTKWEIEVTKVYKGDVKAEDKLVLLQGYYLWTYPNGKEQLVTLTDLKPAEKDSEYLMFLKYDERNEGYWSVGDYEGMFAIPTDEMKEKAKDMTMEQADFDVYNYETLNYLIPIYYEVVQEYFD